MSKCQKCGTLERELAAMTPELDRLRTIVGNIAQVVAVEGNSLTILTDNPEADSLDTQCAVECCGDFTDWQVTRFWGVNWVSALEKAAKCARDYYCQEAAQADE